MRTKSSSAWPPNSRQAPGPHRHNLLFEVNPPFFPFSFLNFYRKNKKSHSLTKNGSTKKSCIKLAANVL